MSNDVLNWFFLTGEVKRVGYYQPAVIDII